MRTNFLAVAATLLAIGYTNAAIAADKFGDCELTGTKGSMPVSTVVPGQVTVQVALPAPGWYNGDTPETIKDGYEYCMAANMAYRAGYDKLAIVNATWDSLIAGQTRNYDFALSEATITEARKKVVSFSIPYFSSDLGVLVKKGTKVDEKTIKDMRIGVHQGTTGADFATNVLKPTKPVKTFPDTPGMFVALAAGQIDVVLTDTAYVLGQAAKSNGMMVTVGQYSTGEEYGAVYPKDGKNNAEWDKIIKSMQDDGTLKKLAHKYLAEAWGADPTQIPYWKH
ncbi:ABC transporter substrate-binding protein [Dongia soli]|uniref:ABC transporter substrate-binding protein n=1 Tax=Dongia soli TaxID=600628 RepID=A0ABU5EEN5_9PROT|nr:ABC transporter substrate-binding protein [Dongia soli]MDY0884806.1 ABC transporter substrate-binding protein [Dongia soli]